MLAPWDLGELYQNGFRVVVTLNEEGVSDDIIRAGLRHHRFALPTVLILTEADMETLMEGVEAALPVIRGEITAGRPVLVHCHAGKDRTGVMLASYLMRYEGMAPEEAIACLRALRSNVMSAPGYEETARYFGALEHRGPGEEPVWDAPDWRPSPDDDFWAPSVPRPMQEWPVSDS
jgi:atypical dual specificity phosphatase